MANRTRDLSRSQFDAACARRGYTPSGVLGYFEVAKGFSVSVHNTNSKRRRVWLAYLIEEEAKYRKRNQ